jgi:hypothetical protein
MVCHSTCRSWDQRRIEVEVSSGPLSLTTISGLPRIVVNVSSSRATRAPDSDVSATSARHSRVKSSTTQSIQNRRPQANASLTKSRLQRWLGPCGIVIGALVPSVGHLALPRPTGHDFSQRHGLLFVGALHAANLPNFDSLPWFVRDIMPLLTQTLGNTVRLTIAGHVAPGVRTAAFADDPRIDLLGEVDDLTALYDSHRVFIAPTRYAGGFPYKVHEAASFGLPVVATSVLCDQLGWTDDAAIRDGGALDPARFAEQVTALYADETVWHQTREAALARIAAENNEASFHANLQRILQDTLACGATAGS